MSKDIESTAREAAAAWNMIAERRPELAPVIQEQVEELRSKLIAMAQPWEDFAKGRITWEELSAILAQHQAEDLAERLAHYGDGPHYALLCTECGEQRDWDRDEMNDVPPLSFECEDLDGESCQTEEEELIHE